MKNKKGFTLVELLAVIAILAILVIIALPNVIDMFTGARENAFKVELQSLYGTAKKKYLSDMFSSSSSNVFYYSDKDNQLPISGGDNIKYSVKVQSGKILCFQATNGLMYYTGTNIEDAKDIKNFVEVNAENPDITPDCSNKTTIYASKNGLDSNNGSKDKPVKTIKKAVELIGANDGKVLLLDDVNDVGTVLKNNNTIEVKSVGDTPFTIYNHSRDRLGTNNYNNKSEISLLSSNKNYKLTTLAVKYDDDEDDSDYCYGIFCVEEGSTLITSNVKLDGGNSGTPVNILSGTYIMNDKTYITKGPYYRSTCVIDEGTFIMNGGEIYECKGDCGSAIEVRGKFVMNGGTIRDSGFGYINEGSPVIIARGGTFEMNGGTFKENKGNLNGAVTIREGAKFKMTGGSFINNTCTGSTGNGGAIYSRGETEITGGYFLGNTVTHHSGSGGAISIDPYYIGKNSNINISNVTFVSNEAAFGGAISVGGTESYDIDINIKNCTFDNNYAKLNGGAFYTAFSKDANISDSKFINNSANGHSGAVNTQLRGKLTIDNSIFSNNSVNTRYVSGMGWWATSGAIGIYNDIIIKNSTITGNRAIIETSNDKAYFSSIGYEKENNIVIKDTTIDGTCGYYESGIPIEEPCSSLVSR